MYCDGRLQLAVPDDGAAVERADKACAGAARVDIAREVGVAEDLQWRRAVVDDAHRGGAADIAEDSHGGVPVLLLWSAHEASERADGLRDVGARAGGQVEQAADELAEERLVD